MKVEINNINSSVICIITFILSIILILISFYEIKYTENRLSIQNLNKLNIFIFIIGILLFIYSSFLFYMVIKRDDFRRNKNLEKWTYTDLKKHSRTQGTQTSGPFFLNHQTNTEQTETRTTPSSFGTKAQSNLWPTPGPMAQIRRQPIQ